MSQPSYYVPIVQTYTEGPILGSPLLTNKCTVVVQYDTGNEFPSQPFKDWITWINCLWQQVPGS